jgi:ABC-type lipoprotein export system ATPase subunit
MSWTASALWPRRTSLPANSPAQQQLVAVARAIIGSPKMILADEPIGNLCTDQGRENMELFKKLNRRGTPIAQVTHNEAWAAYGPRIIRLKDGWTERSET